MPIYHHGRHAIGGALLCLSTDCIPLDSSQKAYKEKPFPSQWNPGKIDQVVPAVHYVDIPLTSRVCVVCY